MERSAEPSPPRLGEGEAFIFRCHLSTHITDSYGHTATQRYSYTVGTTQVDEDVWTVLQQDIYLGMEEVCVWTCTTVELNCLDCLSCCLSVTMSINIYQ